MAFDILRAYNVSWLWYGTGFPKEETSLVYDYRVLRSKKSMARIRARVILWLTVRPVLVSSPFWHY
jgi:hypothetical protein